MRINLTSSLCSNRLEIQTNPFVRTRENLHDPKKKFLYKTLNAEITLRCFPGGSLVKNLPANAGDTGSIPDLGRSNMKTRGKVAQSCRTLCDPMDYTVHGILQPRILEWLSHSLLQGIFPTQGSNPGLPHCRQITPGMEQLIPGALKP